MATDSARVPTSNDPQRSGWSLETAIDHLLAVVNERHARVITLIEGNDKRYEERFSASQKALELGLSGQKSEISAALAAADRAVLKAEVATEKRFESVNEFRGTLDQQQRTLIPRSEVDVLMRGVEEKIVTLNKSLDETKATIASMQSERTGIKGGYGYAVGIVGFVLTVASLGVLLFQAVK
jgi:hypothetical protein